MHSSSSSPSLTVAVRVLYSLTNASSTGASESQWCVCCGNLDIMTVLGGVLCQITSIQYVLGLDVLKSFACSPPPPRPPRPQIALGTVLMLHPSYLIPPLPFHSPFLFCCLVLVNLTIFALARAFAKTAVAAASASTSGRGQLQRLSKCKGQDSRKRKGNERVEGG